MKIAIPHWQGRISPVFDVAHNVLLVDVDDGQEQSRQNLAIETGHPLARVNLLAGHRVTVLICGAISWPLNRALVAAGVQVIPHACGEVEPVLTAYLNGRLQRSAFLMPGCLPRRRFRGRWEPGVRRGPVPAGTGEECVCPKCGQRVPHVAGRPCRNVVCPRCATTMIRG